MKISSYHQLIVAFTLISGLLVFSLLWHKYEETKNISQQHYQVQLSLNKLEHFSTMSKIWLTTQDLYYSGKQSYLADGINTQSIQLMETVEQVTQTQQPALIHLAFLELKEYIKANNAIIVSLATNANSSDKQWNQAIEKSDKITSNIINNTANLVNYFTQTEVNLSKQKSVTDALLIYWVLSLIMVYLLFIFWGAWWLSKNMVKPLENITEIANQQLKNKNSVEFRQATGPKEIIKLADAIQTFTQNIQLEKINAQRERNITLDTSNRLNAIMDTVPTGIVLIDDHGIIRDANFATENLFQQSMINIKAHSIHHFIPALFTLGNVLDKEHILQNNKETILAPQITQPHIEFSGRLLAIDNQEYYLLSISDINERKLNQQALNQLNEQLIQSEKMASVGQLSAGIAHEINNPVGYIRSNIDVLKEYIDILINYMELLKTEGVGDKSSHYEQEHDLDFILSDIASLISSTQEGSQRITQIINNLGQYAHKDENTMEAFNIDQLVIKSLSLASNELKYKAEVTTQLNAAKMIKGFPQKLLQVFINLLVNASHAIAKKGTIHIQSTIENSTVKISIKDSGSGISPENINKLFDPFFTTKPIGKGTGLGLHIVHNIITEHQGLISVNSQLGKGTEFIITLPLADET
jgi:PAS domain S-box-containing protein